MQFKRMLLMFSALITITYSSPTRIQHNVTTSLPQNETTTLNTKEDRKPLVVVTEEKDPKSDSVVVQFVYTSNGDNSIIESKGTDKERYTVVDYPKNKEQSEQKSTSEKEKKITQVLNKDKTITGQNNDLKPDSTKHTEMMPLTSLMPEEVSPLSGKWPKYFYDAFNPIPPFPELQFGKPNQINTKGAQNENTDTYIPYYEKEKKEPLNVAGPQLSPLSIFDREFNVPIFD